MNKKIVLSVFLGLLASASALVASLFMLQQLSGTANLPQKIANLETAYQNINTTVDLGPVTEDISYLSETVQTMGRDLNELQNEVEKVKTTKETNADKPYVEEPKVVKPVEPKPVPNTEPTAEKPNFVTEARLNFRTESGIKANILRTLSVGEQLTFLDEKIEKDGYTWLKVKDTKGKTGWVAKKYTTSN